MGDKTKQTNTPNTKTGEIRHDGVNHEHFNLQSSQAQPFDNDRMSGKPVKSNEDSGKPEKK